MPEWIYRNTDAREDNQRDTVHFSAGKIWLHTKKNILFFSCWKISLLQVHIHVWNILLIKISIRYHIQFIKMAQQGKSAHIHLLQKELYYTETQHISFTHLSVLPISPDNNDLKKKKERKKNQVKISLAPFYGGLFSPLYATWLTSSHSVRNTHKPAQLIFVPL